MMISSEVDRVGEGRGREGTGSNKEQGATQRQGEDNVAQIN